MLQVSPPPAAVRDSLADLLARIESPPAGNDAAAERQVRAEQLVGIVGGDRACLESVRSAFLRRLHQASGDFGATEGLRTVEAALWLIPWGEGPSD